MGIEAREGDRSLGVALSGRDDGLETTQTRET